MEQLKKTGRSGLSSVLIASVVLTGVLSAFLILMLMLQFDQQEQPIPLIQILDSSKTLKITLA